MTVWRVKDHVKRVLWAFGFPSYWTKRAIEFRWKVFVGPRLDNLVTVLGSRYQAVRDGHLEPATSFWVACEVVRGLEEHLKMHKMLPYQSPDDYHQLIRVVMQLDRKANPEAFKAYKWGSRWSLLRTTKAIRRDRPRKRTPRLESRWDSLLRSSGVRLAGPARIRR